jgi:hypothetical protein
LRELRDPRAIGERRETKGTKGTRETRAMPDLEENVETRGIWETRET